ncbi:MAG: TOBE domain-containing protein [Gammaproteobacteria bacterium]|nr:TOBE domain-containing protein [Gammaproteobacteria bacterium]
MSTDESFVQNNANVVIALRPEKLLLSKQQNFETLQQVKSTLNTLSYPGDRCHFYVSVDGHENPVAVACQETGFSSGTGLEKGGDVWLSWAEESTILLPARPEHR